MIGLGGHRRGEAGGRGNCPPDGDYGFLGFLDRGEIGIRGYKSEIWALLDIDA